MKRGYSIVAYTDHDIFLTHNDLTDDKFLALNGFEAEIDGPKREGISYRKTCHICFVALDPDNDVHPLWHREKYLFANAVNYRDQVKFDENEPNYERVYSGECISDMMTRARSKGFFVTYNHPTWSLEDFGDYMGYSGMNAFEMFNGACLSTGYEDYNPRVYDDMLRANKRIYCIGADDNHNFHSEGSRRFDSGRAYTVIKADSLDYRSITKALEEGNFYASEGPEIYNIWYEDGKAHIECSEADRISCNYDMRGANIEYAENGKLITEATFRLPEDCAYFRFTVTDSKGYHACTNAYFIDTLK